jgi:hypothetical protein
MLAGFAVGIVGAVPYVMVNAFPPVVRFSGLSFSYNVAYAIFGGLTPAGHALDEGGRAGPLPLCGQPGCPRFRARHLALAAPARPTPGHRRPPDPSKAPSVGACSLRISSTGWRSRCGPASSPQSVHPEVHYVLQVVFLALLALLPMVNPPTTATLLLD